MSEERKLNSSSQTERRMPERKFMVGTDIRLSGGGSFKLKIKRDDGEVEEVVVKNLITDLGLDILVRNLTSINPVSLTHLVVSDATTTPSPNETVMPGTNKWAVAATPTRPSPAVVTWSGAFSKGAIVGTIGSIGLCSDSAGNNLFARVRIDPPKQVGANDTVELEYSLQLTRAQ